MSSSSIRVQVQPRWAVQDLTHRHHTAAPPSSAAVDLMYNGKLRWSRRIAKLIAETDHCHFHAFATPHQTPTAERSAARSGFLPATHPGRTLPVRPMPPTEGSHTRRRSDSRMPAPLAMASHRHPATPRTAMGMAGPAWTRGRSERTLPKGVAALPAIGQSTARTDRRPRNRVSVYRSALAKCIVSLLPDRSKFSRKTVHSFKGCKTASRLMHSMFTQHENGDLVRHQDRV